MKQSRSVVITGANGFVGRNVGKFLSKDGFDVIGLVRKGNEKSINFARVISSETLSENYLVSKIKGCSALLHFIGQGRQTVDSDYEKVNVSLTKNVIKLCKKARIKKIIYISGLGVDKSSYSWLFYFKIQS